MTEIPRAQDQLFCERAVGAREVLGARGRAARLGRAAVLRAGAAVLAERARRAGAGAAQGALSRRSSAPAAGTSSSARTWCSGIPHKIRIGDNVVIDDNCLIDAKGDANRGITIGSGVFVGRNSILSCKNGDIEVADGANVGFNCEVFSASRVTIGRDTLLAAYCYVIGGDHDFSDPSAPVLAQGRRSSGVDDRRGRVARRRARRSWTASRSAIARSSAPARSSARRCPTARSRSASPRAWWGSVDGRAPSPLRGYGETTAGKIARG